MVRYHKNDKGEEARCDATIRECPKDHIDADSPQEAREYFETLNAQEAGGAFGNIKTQKKDPADKPLDISDGDSIEISGAYDTDIWDRVEVIHSDGRYTVEATVYDEMQHVAPNAIQRDAEMLHGHDMDAKAEYINEYMNNRMHIIEPELRKQIGRAHV